MKRILYISSLLLFLLTFNGVNAQHTVMRTPGRYLMPMDNASAAFPGSGSKKGALWVVFSDRPENAVYSNKACTNATGEKLDFMQVMYVVDESENAVKVVPFDAVDFRGNLKDGAAVKAVWALKNNMLLWRTCLKTRDVNLPGFKDGIFNKKAMVLNIISDDQQTIRVPEYYSNPRCQSGDSVNSALVYQINYVYKETPNAYLLGDIPEIEDVEQDVSRVKGWVLKSQTTAWNHRLAYEVNWDDEAVAERKQKGIKAKITSQRNGGDAIFTEGPGYYENRDIGEVDRFPVLDVYNGESKVGVIGDLRSEDGETLSSLQFANIKHVIDSMSGALRNVNIIFVVGASSSMVPYSGAIQNALKRTVRNLLDSKNNYRFGILLYRDASEGKANTVQYSRDLTSNYNSINSTLSRFMTPSFNRCNKDPEEAVFYGMKRAIERFDPPSGESNFMVLIGDAGNHNRTTFVGCDNQEHEDYTNVQEEELVDLMVKKNINLFAYQMHHHVAADMKPAYDAFRSQIESIMTQIAIKRNPSNGLDKSNILRQNGREVSISSAVGVPGYFKKAPEGGSVHPSVFMKELSEGITAIDQKVNYKLEGISEYLNGKIEGDHARELNSFITSLNKEGISNDELDIVFQKNGQVYNTGYTSRFSDQLKYPLYQDVLLMSRQDMFYIKRSLERLIPTDEMSLPPNESRSFIVYGWSEILVDILGYFPEGNNEAIDTLSLYTLSSILTGWGGKEKYKDIKLLDVTSPQRFPDVMLYEYLIDWCITKGHIQSIYEGQNLLTEDFFEDHMWTIFYEYLYHLTNGAVDSDPDMKEKFRQYFEKYNEKYNNYKATFSIPMGTGSGLKHYWIDSRIFPHQTESFGQKSIIETLYGDYTK